MKKITAEGFWFKFVTERGRVEEKKMRSYVYVFYEKKKEG